MYGGELRSSLIVENACDVRATPHQGNCHATRKLESNTEVIKVCDDMLARGSIAAADGEVGDESLIDKVGLHNPRGITDGKGAILGLDKVWMHVLRGRSFIENEVEPASVGG